MERELEVILEENEGNLDLSSMSKDSYGEEMLTDGSTETNDTTETDNTVNDYATETEDKTETDFMTETTEKEES